MVKALLIALGRGATLVVRPVNPYLGLMQAKSLAACMAALWLSREATDLVTPWMPARRRRRGSRGGLVET